MGQLLREADGDADTARIARMEFLEELLVPLFAGALENETHFEGHQVV